MGTVRDFIDDLLTRDLRERDSNTKNIGQRLLNGEAGRYEESEKEVTLPSLEFKIETYIELHRSGLVNILGEYHVYDSERKFICSFLTHKPEGNKWEAASYCIANYIVCNKFPNSLAHRITKSSFEEIEKRNKGILYTECVVYFPPIDPKENLE